MRELINNNISEVKILYHPDNKSSDSVHISGAQDAVNILYGNWDKDTLDYCEEFKILLLNRANNVLGIASLFKGGITGTVIDVRVIFQYALLSNALCIILCHNHPSGNLKPSDADLSITRKLVEAAKLLDLTILDHIILSSAGDYFSMAESGDV